MDKSTIVCFLYTVSLCNIVKDTEKTYSLPRGLGYGKSSILVYADQTMYFETVGKQSFKNCEVNLN